MLKSAFLICLLTSFSTVAMAANFLCVNKSAMNENFWLQLNGDNGALSVDRLNCPVGVIPYNPRSQKYKGWMRLAPTGLGQCTKIGERLFSEPSDMRGDLDIHWISLSTEIQLGNDGFAQVGFANLWDPGSGGTVAANVRCFRKK